MANRLIRDGICTSDSINALSPEEEVLFYRLLVVSDDYGHADARPAIIKAQCFPLKENATIAKVTSWIKGLADKRMIRRYEHGGKTYLAVCKWENRIRTHPKYPQPDEDGSVWIDAWNHEDTDCQQSAADRQQSAAECGLGLGLGLGLGEGEKENKKEKKETVQPSGFTEFWTLYPSHPRKGGKANCLQIWISKKLENKAQQILTHLAWQKKDWAKSNNDFVQMPSSYLRAAKWDGWVDMGEQKRERGFVS